MTDEFIPSADNQPVLEGEQPPALIPGGEPAVYEIETAPEAVTAFEVMPPAVETDGLTFREWLRAIFGSHESPEARIAELSQMIEVYPEAPANYVLRGELRLKAGAYEPAADDFRRALELAARQVETSDWGFIAQAAQDRALSGLEKAERRLHSVSNQP